MAGRWLRCVVSRKDMLLIGVPVFILVLCASVHKLNVELEEDVGIMEAQLKNANRMRVLRKSTYAGKLEPKTAVPAPSKRENANETLPPLKKENASETLPPLKKENANETTSNLTVSMNQNLRKQRISEVCQQHKKLSTNSAHWTYKLNTKDRYLLCPIPKAGWSSWKRLWFYTSGVIDSYNTDVGVRNDRQAHVDDVSGERSVQAIWKKGAYDYSFVFVRNPWERLVSAYINKAVDHNYSRILHSPCKWESMKPYKPDLTFLQFLTCVVQGSNDEHWRPQWNLCNVCKINFDFVGHLETVEEDAQYVLAKVGVNAKYPHSFPSKKYSTKNVMEEWYRDIPVDLLRKLVTRYEYDFELHGYSKQPPGKHELF